MNDKIPTGSPLREALDRVNAMAGKLYPVGPETFAKIRTQEFRELQAAQEKPAPAPVTRSVQEISKNVDDTKALIEATKAKLAEYESDLKRELEELARACDKIDERTAELRKQYLPPPPVKIGRNAKVAPALDPPPCHPEALWVWSDKDAHPPVLVCSSCGTPRDPQPGRNENAKSDLFFDAVTGVVDSLKSG